MKMPSFRTVFFILATLGSIVHTSSFAISHSKLMPLTAPASASSSALRYNEKNQDSSENPSWWLSHHSDESKDQEQEDQSSVRKERLIQMQQDMVRFAQGKDLEILRADLDDLKQNLKWSLATDDLSRVISLKKAIEEKEQRDPEVVYVNALKKIANAGKLNTRKKYETIGKYTKEAISARQYIARMNLEGLWIGNFQEGSQLVNVTYSGDTIIGTKVTGDTSERNQLLFQADLSPPDNDASELSPIPLHGSAKTKWGTEKLERYQGEGNDPKARSKNENGLVDGNLIMFDGYFSFLWIPTRRHVFFSRPNPDLILHMMRDAISEEDEMQNMKDHLSRCFDKNIDEAFIGVAASKSSSLMEPFRRIATEADLLAAKEEIQIVFPLRDVPDSGNSNGKDQAFWGFHKWMNYIDNALNPNEGEQGENKR